MKNETNEILLRPYQNSIIKSVKDSTGSVLIEAPTGVGKSIMACEIAKNEMAKGGKVLIVAPKIILLEQLQETFKELEPQTIHASKDYDVTHSVFISTLQTAYKRELGFEPTMIIIDEIHFGFTGKMIETLLEDYKGRLIGLSATPYNQNSNPIEGFDLHINEFDLNYMFENGYLVRPICYAPVKVDLSDIKVQAGDYNQKVLDKSFNNFENISQIVVNTKELIAKQKSALIFCINISHANAVATAFTEAGLPTKAIHSKLSKKERKNIMQEYKSGKVKMLANPMILTTGFDDPATDCIVLARATKSQNLYRQMVGRGLRLFEGKTHAKIIDCAGVIDNLGLPTEPQKTKKGLLSKPVICCPSCESSRIYKIKEHNGDIVRKCADCDYNEKVKKQGCECEACGVINGSSAKYFTKASSLYLECSECSHSTLISSASSAQELRNVFNDKLIRDMQMKYSFAYMRYLHYMNGSFDINYREDVSRHISAFHIYIAENIPNFINPKSIDNVKNTFNFLNNLRFLDSDEYHPDKYKSDGIDSWNWEKESRLFDLELEAQLLGVNVEDIKKSLHDIQNPIEALEFINELLSTKGGLILDKEQQQVLQQQLKITTLEDAERLCTERLKEIYYMNEPIEDILKFIPMREVARTK